jgi:transposase
VDLQTHRPLDLLVGREAPVLADWLRAHPGVEIVVRDRAEAYAEGARAGAPGAQQVADRFHLVQNASTALDELVRAGRRSVSWTTEEPVPPTDRPPSATRQQKAARRQARVARWEKMRALREAGWNLSQIAREMATDRKTVRRLLATPAPTNRPRSPRPGGLSSPTLQPFVGYLQDRWQSGCQNICQLHREITARGYPGSYSLLNQALRPWRAPRAPPGTRRQRHRRSLRWLCLRPRSDLKPDEIAALDQALADDPALNTGYELRQRFTELVRARDLAALHEWIAAARQSELPPFVALANGLVADWAAVEAALRLPWSNGPVEGQVNRVKFLKRQGYGRAKLDLLRARVLAA